MSSVALPDSISLRDKYNLKSDCTFNEPQKCQLAPSNSFFKIFPLVTPALQRSVLNVYKEKEAGRGYTLQKSVIICKPEVDFHLIHTRSSAMSFLAVITVCALNILMPINALMIGIAAGAVIGLTYLDVMRAENAANRLAAQEYKKLDHPSELATSRIQSRFGAARYLFKKGMNKTNEKGEKIMDIDSFLSFEIFVDLLKQGYDPKSIPLEFFLQNKPEIFEYVMKEKLLKPEDFTYAEKLALWLGTNKTLKTKPSEAKQIRYFSPMKTKLMKDSGFDINEKDEDGHTILMRLAQMQWGAFGSPLDIAKSLIENGADRSQKVKWMSMNYTAHDLCENEELKKLLKSEELKKD